MEKRTYSTGKFAKLASATERTIRYYDKIGLLKPSFVMSNGYRQYTDEDLIKLQKILALRYLGFSIEEIFPLVLNENDIKESFELQTKLIDSKISHLSSLKESMKLILNSLEKGQLDWSRIISLVQLSNGDDNIIEHYKNTNNLNVRISLHDQYSINSQGWFPWILEQIDFTKIYRLLEVGCGNGKLWKKHKVNLRNREIFLSDSSQGMVEEVRKNLGNDFNCMQFDCEKIPFKTGYFDAVVANHVLFYVHDMDVALKELARVLNQKGVLYCTTYGEAHMREIDELVKGFDSRIELSKHKLSAIFGLENGYDLLNTHFENIELRRYEDFLIVDHSKPLIDYILSCHGNQNEIIGSRINEFKVYIDQILQKEKYIKISKDAGLFICQKKAYRREL